MHSDQECVFFGRAGLRVQNVCRSKDRMKERVVVTRMQPELLSQTVNGTITAYDGVEPRTNNGAGRCRAFTRNSRMEPRGRVSSESL